MTVTGQLLKCWQPTKDVGGRKCWRPNSYYLGSAESPLCLLLSPAEDLSLLHEVLSPPEELSLRWCCLSSMQASSGICSQTCPAYMGGVSAVLYRLVCTARPVQMSVPFKCSRPPTFHLSSGNFRRSLGADCSAPRTLIKEL